MQDEVETNVRTSVPPAISPMATLLCHLMQGLRMAFFLAPKGSLPPFSWGQLLSLIALGVTLPVPVQYVMAGGGGSFSTAALPGVLFFVPLLLAVASLLPLIHKQTAATGTLLMAVFSLSVPIAVADPFLRTLLQDSTALEGWLAWLVYYSAIIWLTLAVSVAAIRVLKLPAKACPVALLLPALLLFLPLTLIYRDDAVWIAANDPQTTEASLLRYNTLSSEDNFYRQPLLLEQSLNALKTGQPGKVELFFIGAAGYATQDVFMREVNSVTALFAQRFATQGHSIRLVNNVATVADTPIVSTTAIRKVLQRMASLMNADEDILFLFMTSHGSREHKFSLEFGALRFNDLDPAGLRKLLDESGIKRRVVVISACYSGGFVDALKDDNTLVITAAAADKNSFGCANENDYTYFGKAYFDEALRKTYSFTDAFLVAKPVIAEREKQAGYTPSEPQMFIGKNIAPVLDAYAKTREQVEQATE